MDRILLVLICWLILACLVTEAIVDVVYPRSGDTYYPTICSRDNICQYAVPVTVLVHSQPDTHFTFDVTYEGAVIGNFAHTHRSSSLSKAQFWMTLVPTPATASVTLLLTIRASGEVVRQDELDLVFLQNADLPGQLAICPHLACTGPGACVLDYLEIGTSNFDTAAQQAVIAMANHPNMQLKGISVEPVRNYLDQLPVLVNSCKVHAAVKASHETTAVGHIYFIPETIINRTALPEWLKACSTMDTPGDLLLAGIFNANLSSAIIQRQAIPLLGPDQLLQYAPDGLKLLKTDIEGMDTKVMQSVLDFYEARALSLSASQVYALFHGARVDGRACQNPLHPYQVIDRSWPCVLMFETMTTTGNIRDPLLMNRLKALGYILLHELPDVQWLSLGEDGETYNSAGINCACSLSDIVLANFLGEMTTNEPEFFRNVCAGHWQL